MHIEENKHRYPFSETTLYRHVCRAADHAAGFHAHLALARWTRGGDIPHVFASTQNVPARAVWYAQAQHHFAAWLADGGFHAWQSEPK